MGHHELDGMVRTPPYKRVVAILGDSAGMAGTAGIPAGTLEEVADATLDASDEGLQRAKSDEGLSYCLYLMTRLTQAAEQDDFLGAISEAGMPVPPDLYTGVPDARVRRTPPQETPYTVFDLIGAFSTAVDSRLRQTRGRTDIGELSQLAAAESLSALCTPKAETLFGSTEQTVKASLRRLSSARGFASLTHDFFSRFARRYLEYHLSRELSNHVGRGRRFASVSEHNEFLQELDSFCRVSASAMRRFAGQWYRRHDFQGDLTLDNTKGFAAHAVDKLRDSLRYHGGGDDD